MSIHDDLGALPGEWAEHPGRPCADPALGTPRQRAHTRARRDTRTVNRRRRYLAVLDRIVRKAA